MVASTGVSGVRSSWLRVARNRSFALPAARVRLVGLPHLLLGPLPRGDVADVALDDHLVVDVIDVADELHFHVPSILGFERQILVPDIPLLLQFSKRGPARVDVPEQADIPEVLAQQFGARIAQQVQQERVRVGNRPGVRIEDEDAILGRLEEPPKPDFGSRQGVGHLAPLGDVLDGEEDHHLPPVFSIELACVDVHDPRPDRGEGPLDLESAEGCIPGQDVLQERPQPVDVPLAVAEVEEGPVYRLFR